MLSTAEAKTKALKDLTKHGLKKTKARKAVLELLYTKHGPFTVEEIHGHLSQIKCDLVTVYRVLETFAACKLASRCHFGDNIARYEFNPEQGEDHHHHLVCTGCRKVVKTDICIPADWKESLLSLGFKDVSHNLDFFGTCVECAHLS